jgi:YidC/Oxa1 family membrane protein insertase
MWDTFIIAPFLNALLYIYTLVWNNFGLAIILFTILIKLITHPLMVKQIKGAQAMTDLQKDPRWIEAQKKYKGDKEKLSQVQMQLYKELGVNPFASCLPTLIQFPIIIGLYQSIMLGLASSPLELLKLTGLLYPNFLDVSTLIPLNSRFLWMDLGLPESLKLSFLPFGIPILAIIVLVTTYLQSRLMTPPSANPGDQGAQMSKMMNLYMPFLMGYLALTFSSGLAVYFVASNLVGILQYALLGKLDIKNLIPGMGKKQESVVDIKPVKSGKDKINQK